MNEYGPSCRYSLERLSGGKHSSLLVPFVSCKDNKVLWILLLLFKTLFVMENYFVFTFYLHFITIAWVNWGNSWAKKKIMYDEYCPSCQYSLESLQGGQKLQLIGPICKLQRKWSAMNTATGVCHGKLLCFYFLSSFFNDCLSELGQFMS
jgi:hypothetical protein